MRYLTSFFFFSGFFEIQCVFNTAHSNLGQLYSSLEQPYVAQWTAQCWGICFQMPLLRGPWWPWLPAHGPIARAAWVSSWRGSCPPPSRNCHSLAGKFSFIHRIHQTLHLQVTIYFSLYKILLMGKKKNSIPWKTVKGTWNSSLLKKTKSFGTMELWSCLEKWQKIVEHNGEWKKESEVAQSCLTLWDHGLQPTRLLRPWNFPGKSTRVGCHCFLQGIFPTQG